tara:strand:+ start:458 stop:1441 length:984 start_codon:yes stop_codon:yes gene_type:complete
MKKILLVLLSFSAVNFAFGQDLFSKDFKEIKDKKNQSVLVVAEVDSTWRSGGLLGFNASQTLLSNWSAGGQSSITGTAYVNLFRNYTKNSWTWDNTLDLSYGLLNNGIIEGSNVKIDDKIDFASKAGRKATGDWYYSALVNFRSQFAPGYEVIEGAENRSNKISDFLAPAFALVSIGMDYKPNGNFSVYISPFTAKNTIVNEANSNLRSNYGFGTDELEQAVRFELGGYAKIAYKRKLAENAEWQTKIDLFSNYLQNPQNVDVNWENLIAVKFAKYFNVNFILQMVYDDDIKIQLNEYNNAGDITSTKSAPRLQIRQVFGLGFSYKF